MEGFVICLTKRERKKHPFPTFFFFFLVNLCTCMLWPSYFDLHIDLTSKRNWLTLRDW